MNTRPPSVFVLGLRGFPGVQGGVETHAENLYPLIADLGWQVTCATRSPYHPDDVTEWSGVSFLRTWSPRSQYFEAIVHSIVAVLRAALVRPDIVHIHAIGPAIVTPLARLLGLKVVVTHHGPDYDREKWNTIARGILRLGETLGMRFSNRRIVISQVIKDLVQDHTGMSSDIVPNGVPIPALDTPVTPLAQFGLERGRYVLLVSRFVPEKRHLDLINAFDQAGLSGWKVALVGDSDHPSEYSEALKARASEHADVVLTGFQSGETLRALFQHAGVFVLPSSHEGLPISLLEALSYGLRCIASDIPANLCVELKDERYFPLGDVDALAARLAEQAATEWRPEDRDAVRKWVAERYNWQAIAAATTEVYRGAAGAGRLAQLRD